MKHHETSPGQHVPEAPGHIPAAEPHSDLTTDSGGQVYTIAWNYRSTLDYSVALDGELVGTADTMTEALALVGVQR